jgi:hypothetical protein
VDYSGFEVDLLPTQVTNLSRPQPMPISEQDHRRIAMTMPVRSGNLNDRVHLRIGGVLPSPQLTILETPLRISVRGATSLRCELPTKIPPSECQQFVYASAYEQSRGPSGGRAEFPQDVICW